jgi:hypothetical protein
MLLCHFHDFNWNVWHDKLQEPLEMCVCVCVNVTHAFKCYDLYGSLFQLRFAYIRLTALISIFWNDIPLCFRNSFSQKRYGQ